MHYDYEARHNGWQGYFAPLFQIRTYRNLLYLALALPLGILYFVALITGYSVGLSLLVILVGLPILAFTLAAVEMFLRLERVLSNWLLGTDMRVQPRRKRRGGMMARLRARLTDTLTWRGHIFLMAKFAFGIAAQVLLSVAWAVPLMLIIAPIQDPEISGPLALIPMAIGLGLAPLSARASNGLVDWWRAFAVNMLSEPEEYVTVPEHESKRVAAPELYDYDDDREDEDPVYYGEKPKRKAKTLAELLGEE